MLAWQKNLNAIAILILVAVLLSAFGVQFILKEKPCPLCLLQRLCMIGVASSLLLNLIFEIQMAHYALALFSCVAGGFVALRQISLHVCPGFPEFGLPVLGMSLYTWSFMIFVCSVLGIAVLLSLYRPKDSLVERQPLNILDKTAAGLLLFIALANIVTTFMQCGFGPCQD